ncbi:three prime repair exonuclease 4 [Anguilla rostrata]|uniref:three prime repair exonuclease 4 n=1 Tax=Anguilla rostrata TaxID=7938 RepID=UPI0030D0EC44
MKQMDLYTLSPVSGSRPAGCSLVFFDLETTGLGRSCDIVQLSAVSGGHSCNLYVLPRCRIQSRAAAITGFSVRRRRLYLHGHALPTVPLPQALAAFLAFLRMLGRPLLVGHNVRRFDCRVLARALDEWHLREAFQEVTSGFLDTLPLARDLLKGRGQQSFRQESLVKAVLGVSYPAHDALEDVQALQRLYHALLPTAEQALRHTFTLASMAAPAK